MMKDPVKIVGFMVILLCALLLMIVIASIVDKQKDTMFLFSILFLQMSMVFVYNAFKHLQKRIDALEEKLNAQNRQT